MKPPIALNLPFVQEFAFLRTQFGSHRTYSMQPCQSHQVEWRRGAHTLRRRE
jgi:hypothetical protein